jgi:hypothetical protein
LSLSRNLLGGTVVDQSSDLQHANPSESAVVGEIQFEVFDQEFLIGRE